MFTGAKQVFAAVVGVAVFSLGAISAVRAQEPPPESRKLKPEPAQAAASARPRAEDFQDARLILMELDDQLRIAGAKLRKDALARKDQMGRLRAQLVAVDQEIQVQAADAQRLKERHDQMVRDLTALEEGADEDLEGDRTAALLKRSQAALDEAQARLERLTALRMRLDRQLRQLRTEHLRKLLEAALPIPSDSPARRSAVEIILESPPGDADRAAPQKANQGVKAGDSPTPPKPMPAKLTSETQK